MDTITSLRKERDALKCCFNCTAKWNCKYAKEAIVCAHWTNTKVHTPKTIS